MRKNKNQQVDVLSYRRAVKTNRTMVKRHYLQWREDNDIPYRCDNPSCALHLVPILWCEKRLVLIMDHKDGCNRNNTPQNLWLLCPNCDSQQETKGGGNRGRIRYVGECGYQVHHRDGKRIDANVFVEGVAATAIAPTGFAISVEQGSIKPNAL